MTVELHPAAGMDLVTLADIFTAGFEASVTPVRMTEDQMWNHIHNNDIDLDASLVAVDSSQYVGIVLTGIRDVRSWIGGIAVNLSHRGQGVGRLLMNTVMADSWGRGLEQVTLEVIESNMAARQMYRRLGFQELRPLLIVERAAAPLPDINQPVRTVPAREALAVSDRLHTMPNPWQRERPSLLAQADRLEGRIVEDDSGVSAYVVGAVRDTGITLFDLGGAPEALAEAVVSLHRERPAATGRLVNLRDDDPAWPVLQSLGYTVKFRQIEMAIRKPAAASD